MRLEALTSDAWKAVKNASKANSRILRTERFLNLALDLASGKKKKKKKKNTSFAKVTAEEFSVGFDRDLEKRLKQVSAYRRKYLGLNSRNYFSSYFISYISSFIWNGMIFF
jgi:hypothetical protein